MKTLELLAPARNLEYGKAAIDCGADAVYIGAPRFGARSAASNEVSDIAQLVQYAHLYFAKVYVALNTILFDSELEEARKLIVELYKIGIDGLIIQDMGILEMDLPPIPLIASTQTNNTTPEHVKFLHDSGFVRVILARELSIEQIQKIREATNIELESFVHGALCVCYSGQCYMSHEITDRSGNRGECSQPCRSSFDLIDNSGKTIVRNRHLLSIKDLNLSEKIADLANAGICSFKIEGRLKDISYLKNITTHYRQLIDNFILSNSDQYRKASSGMSRAFFTPDPERTFNRGFTQYNITGTRDNIASFATQKSMGKYMGKVVSISTNAIKIDTREKINNADGLCFINAYGKLSGFMVNRANGNTIYPNQMPEIEVSTELYRNHDHEFEKLLENQYSERKISVSLLFNETKNGISLSATDEDAICAEQSIVIDKQEARNKDLWDENIRKQLSKAGDTIFSVDKIEIQFSEKIFIPVSILNNLRRDVLNSLLDKRLAAYKPQEIAKNWGAADFYKHTLDYRGNVSNHLSETFYKKRGVQHLEPAFELNKDIENVVLMETRHCIKHELGWCNTYPKQKLVDDNNINYPLYLHNNGKHFKLNFNCAKCVMTIQSSSLI